MADVDVDRLYQLPLADFTAARNELAGRAGGRKAEIKSLRKPNLGAWAVNQLYWRERSTYTRLTGAAERLRFAHARVLAGQKADVAAAEAEHAKALRAATDAVQGILTEAGETGSPTVLHEIRETLQALPSDEPPGRLTRPLKPMGFEALLKMLPGASAASTASTGRRTGPVEAPRPARPETTASPTTDAGDASSKRERAEKERAAREEAKRIEAERKHQRGVLERELREARASERELISALSDAQDALARAEREEQRRQTALEEQRFEVRKQAGKVAAQEEHLKAATDKRTEIERALGQLAKGH